MCTSENVAAGNFLGPGVVRRLSTFRLLVGQGKGAARDGGCTWALSNRPMPDAVEAICWAAPQRRSQQ